MWVASPQPWGLEPHFKLSYRSISSTLNKLGEYKEAFEEQEFELDLLLELSENDLKDTLRQMNLTLGKQLKICKEIRNIKIRKSIDFVQKV